MTRFILLIIVLLLSVFDIRAQDQVYFKVTVFNVNGTDLNSLAIESDIALSFYSDSENNLMFANIHRAKNSQSYGRIYSVKEKKREETEEEYGFNEIKFTWKFFNTYDSDQGTAAVTFTRVFIGNSVKFYCEIINLDTNEILKMEGYQE